MSLGEVRALIVKNNGRIEIKGFQWDIKSKSIGPGIYRVTLERGERTAQNAVNDPMLPSFEKDILAFSEAIRG